jgi:membrane protein DedA with SNARE-associated domain
VSFSLIGSLVDLITWILAAVGLPGLFALMAVESFGIPPIPSEVILPFAGFLVADGTFPLDGTLAASLAGGLVGSYLAYAAGRWWRHRLVGFGVGRLRLRREDLDRVDVWFARRGEATVALARVVPIVRSYVSYPAGTARMEPARFGLYTMLGATPWTLAMLYAGYVLGSRWTVIERYFQPLDIALVIGIVATAIYLGLVAVGTLTYGWPPRRVSRPGPAVPSAPAGTTDPNDSASRAR